MPTSPPLDAPSSLDAVDNEHAPAQPQHIVNAPDVSERPDAPSATTTTTTTTTATATTTDEERAGQMEGIETGTALAGPSNQETTHAPSSADASALVMLPPHPAVNLAPPNSSSMAEAPILTTAFNPLPTLPDADASLTNLTNQSLLASSNLLDNTGDILPGLPNTTADFNLLDGDLALLPIPASLPLDAALTGLVDAPAVFPDAMWPLLPREDLTVSGSLGELSHAPLSDADPPPPPPTGFAKLEFPDGHFYMTTYAVELGRDMKAFKMARQHAIQVQVDVKPLVKTHSMDRLPETPVRQIRSVGPASVARSFVSESGGIIGEDDAHVSFGKRRKKRSKKSKSSDSLDSQVLRKNSSDRPETTGNTVAVPATVDPNVTKRLEPSAHMGDPSYIPLIPIHPANLFNEGNNTGKGISRKHVKIAFNFDHARFEMHVQGKNGAFHDNEYYGPGAVVLLHDRSVIQIGGVNINFVLPFSSREKDEDQEDLGSVSGRMSFGFEDVHGESIIGSDAEEQFCSDEDSLNEGFSERFSSDGLLDSSDDDGRGSDEDEEDDEGDNEDQDDDEEGDEVEQGEDEEDGQNDEDSEAQEDETTTPAPRLKIKTKHAMAKEPVRRGRPPKPSIKPAVKIKLKLGKARAEEPLKKLKVKAKELKKETPPAENRKTGSKTTSKAPVKSAIKSASKSTVPATSPPVPSIEPVESTTKDKVRDGEKEESKTTGDQQPKESEGADGAPKEPKAVRVARDEAFLNGEGVNIPDLPAGLVVPARKKGPGRPPKDGIMSKREKAALIKQHKKEELARRMGIDPSELPRDEPRSKPTPKLNANGEAVGDGVDKDGDGDKARVARPPRSPSPEIRIEDYTEEQLQRPPVNYVILIHEAIKNSKTGALNLQQIYSAIERKWPFFKFRTTSNGWQSSVRHNLGQHDAFQQVEKDGKGWLWGIKEGVPIERERKKKATPPPPQMPVHPHGPGSYPQYGTYPGAPRPGAMPNYKPPMGPPRPYAPTPHTASANTGAQAYSSPYGASGTAISAAGPNGQPPAPYATGSHVNRPNPANGASGQSLQSHTRTPPITGALSGARFNPPSQDLVDTFRRVFIGTAQQQKSGMDLESATRIVDNAIRRVLHPETMAATPAEQNELSVAKAFETCLTRAQGPLKRATPAPGQQAPGMQRPAIPNASATQMSGSAAAARPSSNAVMGAASRPVGSAETNTGTAGGRAETQSASPAIGQASTSLLSSSAANGTTANGVGTAVTAGGARTGQSSASVPHLPHTAPIPGAPGLASATSTISRPVSTAATPAATGTATMNATPTPVTAPLPGTAQMQRQTAQPFAQPLATSATAARATGIASSAVSTPRANVLPPAPYTTRPASSQSVAAGAHIPSTVSMPRSVIPAASSVNISLGTAGITASTPIARPTSSGSPKVQVPGPAPSAALAALVMPTTQVNTTQAPRPTTPNVHKPNGLPKITDVKHLNGTASPMRPVVEPLTPPPTVANADTTDVAAGVKRRLEELSADGARAGSGGENDTSKRQKIEA